MKSARINFGQPNTEYILKINDAGEATSCYNQDTDTEYIGGGGGGEGDLVLHKAAITLRSLGGEETFNIEFQEILEGAEDPLYQSLRYAEGTGLTTSPRQETVIAGDEPVVVEIYLMEGAYAVVSASGGSASETGEYTISGNCEVAEIYDTYYVRVTGDCEIASVGYIE